MFSVKDINNEILKNLSIIDLVHFTSINKIATQLLDKDFWLLKYKHEDFKFYSNDFSESYMHEYSKMLKSQLKAKWTLQCNSVEMKRDKSSGIIMIHYQHNNILLKHILTIFNDPSLKPIVDNIDIYSYDLRLTILPTKDKYGLWFTYTDKHTTIEIGNHLCDYKIILSLLTLFYKYELMYDILIVDCNGLKFINHHNDMIRLKINKPLTYNKYKIQLYKRMGIIDALS